MRPERVWGMEVGFAQPLIRVLLSSEHTCKLYRILLFWTSLNSISPSNSIKQVCSPIPDTEEENRDDAVDDNEGVAEEVLNLNVF